MTESVDPFSHTTVGTGEDFQKDLFHRYYGYFSQYFKLIVQRDTRLVVLVYGIEALRVDKALITQGEISYSWHNLICCPQTIARNHAKRAGYD